MTSGGNFSFLSGYWSATNNNHSIISLNPTQAVLITFRIGEVISILCIICGTVGNTTLIFAIYRSSFYRFSYGLLVLFITSFDILSLMATSLYYLLQGNIVPLNLATVTIYIVCFRYARNVTNWLKVFLAIERIIAIKHWTTNRYNVNSLHTTKLQRLRQNRILLLIILLLICTLISQHPNFIPYRYISTFIDPARLLIMTKPNSNFYYGYSVYNDIIFIIISYIILDDLLPIISLICCNTILLYKLRHLPPMTSQKIAESMRILFFLTIFSIFILPRPFIIFCNLYINPKYIDDTTISVVFHTFQSLEMINHAMTGYACILSCQSLRQALKEFIQITYTKLKRTPQTKRNPSVLYTVESSNISSKF